MAYNHISPRLTLMMRETCLASRPVLHGMLKWLCMEGAALLSSHLLYNSVRIIDQVRGF